MLVAVAIILERRRRELGPSLMPVRHRCIGRCARFAKSSALPHGSAQCWRRRVRERTRRGGQGGGGEASSAGVWRAKPRIIDGPGWASRCASEHESGWVGWRGGAAKLTGESPGVDAARSNTSCSFSGSRMTEIIGLPQPACRMARCAAATSAIPQAEVKGGGAEEERCSPHTQRS